ncbi:uncharacterized protein F4812DRAFT_408206 [Daldinia caldariorum]|uniref:uncharacterized protein n=1 Tax=Daldinia caldariorum TaxID=326644 RepID=UPI0020074B6E|nr:uncharacterized protein F4812DRAFT_408206 [Daldinia caldariorum]KAI1472267.1 hypothetical protein F4812DRAFT_408206 [Daldinia caldariorum]
MASRIPPLLDTYLHLPPETSLVLLSGVLGSSTNWLVLRYLYSLLSTPSNSVVAREDDEKGIDSSSIEEASVVFISFLRDYAFWKEGAGKLGLDLDVLTRKGKFIFVDGLSRLFFPSPNPTLGHYSSDNVGKKALSVASLQHLRKELEDAVAQVQRSAPKQRTVLIADQLDLLLAASENDISSQALRDTLLSIREKVHSSIVTLSADEPLLSSQTTSLEKAHAAFAISLAHDAHLVISLRMLDTGTARDVSGVIRVTPSGGYNGIDRIVEERELLYFVAGDGGVRIFERGQ